MMIDMGIFLVVISNQRSRIHDQTNDQSRSAFRRFSYSTPLSRCCSLYRSNNVVIISFSLSIMRLFRLSLPLSVSLSVSLILFLALALSRTFSSFHSDAIDSITRSISLSTRRQKLLSNSETHSVDLSRSFPPLVCVCILLPLHRSIDRLFTLLFVDDERNASDPSSLVLAKLFCSCKT